MNFTEYLGLRVAEIHADGVTIECPLKDFFFNPDATLHGGIIATVADEAVWFAIVNALGNTRNTTTVELNVNFLRPAMNTGTLRARARLAKTGKTLCVGTVDLTDERGTLCAIATVTYMLLGSTA
ncbi:MAG: PaaI family thioesterase [Acidobacteria bacterium]|nr:PaaI family thioesterase [Acidobacteriota bacterium]